MQPEIASTDGTREGSEPTLAELAGAVAQHVGVNGGVRPGVAAELAAEKGWYGRLMDVLGILTEDRARMGYLAGGIRPDEVMTWLPVWADSPFTIEQIRTIVANGGWDPEPFGVVVRHGLLGLLVHRPDGSPRRVKGELAGAWLSDQFPLAEDDEILREVIRVIEEDRSPA
ncbi:MAG TPA: hypothetical protein VFN68_04895 [Acidimicrobiales bacterium]|nr:hypothetical protein [Acidimicrobiales bacterium]